METFLEKLERRLASKTRPALDFLMWDLSTNGAIVLDDVNITPRKKLTKDSISKHLVNWVSLESSISDLLTSRSSQRRNMPLQVDPNDAPPVQLVTQKTMDLIRAVIKETTRPSWMNAVPEKFGEAKTGTLKADEWRNYTTILLPIALTILWGEGSKHDNEESLEYAYALLENTMELVQAITLACYRSTSSYRSKAIGLHLQEYLSNVRVLFPGEDPSTNQHMSLHLPSFIEDFGPVHSWWTFPFERLIGILQRLPTNNIFGKK